MTVGGGGVALIPYDLGCINGVDSSLHFLFSLRVLWVCLIWDGF